MGELLIVIEVELILLASIAAMTFHYRRTDVLSGRYFGDRPAPPAIGRLRRLFERRTDESRMSRAADAGGPQRPAAPGASQTDELAFGTNGRPVQ